MTLKGGEFIIKETKASDIFIPEEWNEEQKMIAQTCIDFIESEINTRLEEIDSQKDLTLVPALMDKAGELGLLGTSIPEQYGGFGTDENTSLLVSECTGRGHSFAVALSAHTGIGTLPILYYGNDAQKEKYIPKLGTGEYKAAYCLTEPDSGSDANSGKTVAALSGDGKHYSITGQKMWITNGGFADVFIVFAKIEDDKNLTGFIVEKNFGGITMNEEEKKMGIKGSSTRQVFFNDCKVPVENMLSERGNGFKIAVNILNIGRVKLAAAATGGMKAAFNHAVNYSNERKQFGVSLSTFGAIKYKLAEMTTKIWISETMVYRIGKDISDMSSKILEETGDYAQSKLKSAEEYAIECAISKVFCSEALDYVVDEGVQIYGGMGFSADAPMDRAYRDSRINRIFEGTNEINRMLTVDMLLKRALKGEMDLMGPAMAVAKELTSVPDFGSDDVDSPFAKELKVLQNLKKACLMIAGAAVQKLMATLKDEQEILMNVADMLIEIYAAECGLLRAQKVGNNEVMTAMAITNLHNAVNKIQIAGKEAIFSFAVGDEERMMLLGLKRFTKIDSYNLKNARRKIADYVIEKNEWSF